MKTIIVVAILLSVFGSLTAQARSSQPPADAKPASSNVPGMQFPKIDPERRACFHIRAPEAKSVSVNLPGGKRMTKGSNGVWTVATDPLAPGFHYPDYVIGGPAGPGWFTDLIDLCVKKNVPLDFISSPLRPHGRPHRRG